MKVLLQLLAIFMLLPALQTHDAKIKLKFKGRKQVVEFYQCEASELPTAISAYARTLNLNSEEVEYA